jgi:crossover junction endodeoxyribonuclease RuvC
LAPSEPLRVLGVDPGTRLVGWAIVEARGPALRALGHGVLRADPRLPMAARLAGLCRGLREVIRAHAPAEAALEEAFHGRNARAALSLGEGRGAVLAVLGEAGLAVTGYANNVVKRAVAGGGRATKDRVQVMVVRTLGLGEEPETLDASDALALALCHHQRRGLAGRDGGGLPPRLAEAIRRAR